MELKDYLKILVQNDGSDLYLTANAPPAAKFHGALKPIEKTVLSHHRIGLVQLAPVLLLLLQHLLLECGLDLAEPVLKLRPYLPVLRQRRSR